jgi:hypothetical protein
MLREVVFDGVGALRMSRLLLPSDPEVHDAQTEAGTAFPCVL